MEKIAICIPTYKNDEKLMNVINSILDVYQENWVILIGEQANINNWSIEKKIFYGSACAFAHTYNPSKDRIKVHQIDGYNNSYVVKSLIELANKLGINRCLIASDNIKFTESMQDINMLLPYFKSYDLIGLNINETFMKFNKSKYSIHTVNTHCNTCYPRKLIIWKGDIPNNFYLIKTNTFKKITDPDINSLSFFWEYKQLGYNVGHTNLFKGEKI